MNSTRKPLAPVVLPVHVSLAVSRPLPREQIERLSSSDHAIYLATVRARQRLLRRGRRNDPMDTTRPSGGYQTVTLT